ncbi:hypothetical protein [Parasphingorhabdus sp.]|uniref:hypothetical protein n=1 Tax=Parasphingorhabdus sp. TaxID=2709688 RepID=UPI003D265D0F
MSPYLQLTLTIAGPIIGIWLGVLLTERKARRERIWDLKAKSYSEIFESLETMRRFFEQAMNDLVRQKDLSSAEENAANEAYRNQRDQLFLLIARESWVLPDKVQNEIFILRDRLRARQESYWESIDDGGGALKSASVVLLDFARTDMATLPRSWFIRTRDKPL